MKKGASGKIQTSYNLVGDGLFSGIWVGETFEELLREYRSSKKKIGQHEPIRVSGSTSFGVDKSGEWWNKPLSPEEMERLQKEVVAKLRGK